jgi:hypothetical protein
MIINNTDITFIKYHTDGLNNFQPGHSASVWPDMAARLVADGIAIWQIPVRKIKTKSEEEE